jgi:hypothetical protein
VSQSSGSSGRPCPEADTPTTRPLERFWPYAELAEEPTPEELAAIDPDLHEALFGAPPGPFSITPAVPDRRRAGLRARAGTGEIVARVPRGRPGEAHRHRATFHSTDARSLRDLFRIVDRYDACEVLVDGRPVPYARELWLPLVWFLLR